MRKRWRIDEGQNCRRKIKKEMRGALVILAAMIVIGLILFITDVIFYRRKKREEAGGESLSAEEKETSEETPQGETAGHGDYCCGTHLICEKTSLLPLSEEIIYYDDEELDRFKGREPESYTLAEEEEFRDVMLTLMAKDVAGWARSITQREIALPLSVREELLMIINEQREIH